LINITNILIFIAHVTISDATKDKDEEEQKNGDEAMLKQVFSMPLPSLALK
jgi:hypothetical protein